jgi:hypothetical protein
VIADLGWEVDDGTGDGELCASETISENCWESFSADMIPELEGIITDCEMTYEWDSCTGTETYCWLKLEVEGLWQEGFCDAVDEWLDFGGSITDECAPDEVRPETESGDCLVEIELSGDYVPGLEACQYQATYDACTGTDISCNAEITLNGQIHSGTCDEMYDLIFGSTTETNCTSTEVREITEEGDCLADVLEVGTFTDGLESCSYTLVYDECQKAEVSCNV